MVYTYIYGDSSLDCMHLAAVINILRQVESMLAIEFALDVRLSTMFP
jgi:hypothetical protein